MWTLPIACNTQAYFKTLSDVSSFYWIFKLMSVIKTSILDGKNILKEKSIKLSVFKGFGIGILIASM